MKKSLILVAFFAIVAMSGFVVAEQGDFSTMGYNTPGGYSYWRVDSSGYLKPGYASTYDIGTAALPVRTIYVGTISGATIASGGAFSGTTGTFSGAVGVGGALTGTSAAFTTTLDADGQTTLGAANTVSTVTSAGVATFHTSVGVPTTGMVFVGLRTLAQLTAATAVMGQIGICSNCSPVEIFISTAAGAPNTGGYGNAAGAQLN